MKYSFHTLTALFLLQAASLSAQGWPDPSSAPASFESVRRHFLQSWADTIPPPGSGYSVFKRWEWFWSTRLQPDGTLPPAGRNAREWQAWLDKHPGTAADSPGADWTSLGPTTTSSGPNGLGRVNCLAFHPTLSGTWWAGAAAGGLWKTTDGGTSWAALTDHLPVLGVAAICVDPTSPQTLYIATGDKDAADTYSVGVLKSTDGGMSWSATGLSFAASQMRLMYQLIIDPTAPQTLLAATTNGVYRTTDGGATWTLTLPGKTFDLAFKPGDAATVYAATGAQLLRSTNGGATWTTVLTIPNSKRIALAVTPADPAVVAAVSARDQPFNGVYRSSDSGQTWTLRAASPNLLARDAAGTSTTGQGWYNLCIAISPTDPTQWFVGGVNLWRSSNAGLAWTLINFWNNNAPPGVPVVHADKHFLAWRDATTLVQANDGGVYASSDQGSTWTDRSNSLVISQLYRIGVSQSDQSVIGGLQDNGTKHRNTAGQWTDHLGADGMDCAIHPTNPAVLYGELQYGALSRSTNGGTTWTNIHATIPAVPLGAWVTPIVLTASGTLFAAYNDVYRTTDMGNSWTAISSNLSTDKLTLLAVAPSNASVVYAGTVSALWRTTNGGASWEPATGNLPTGFITGLAVDPTQPNRLYATIGGYNGGQKVYRSTNGGDTWTNYSGTLPNVPANCIVFQPGGNQAVYVGLDVGVFYRNATMTDWLPFYQGLPNAPVTDLELRTATNTLRAATYGRGVWETPAFPASGPPPPQLAVTPAQQNAGGAAGSTAFSVAANLSWTASSSAPWLTLSPAAGNGNAVLTAIYGANPSAQPRTATITVTADNLVQTVSVSQAGVVLPVCADAGEPANDQRTTAPALVAGMPVLAQITSLSDRDHWAFTVPAGQTVNLSLTDLPADYDLQVYNAGGIPLGGSFNGGTAAESLSLLLPPGTYYVLVAPWLAFSGTQCYTLLLSMGL